MSWVKINYCFIFRPEETWPSITDINHDIGSWLKERGFEAEMVDKKDDEDEITVIIGKKQMIEPPSPPKSVNKQVADLAKNRGYDGRFKK
jgi:hypothetical protein